MPSSRYATGGAMLSPANGSRGGRPAEVLLAEDEIADVYLMRQAFAHADINVNVHVVPNGEECLAFLRKEGSYADAPTPDLLFLDINMPRMNGRETLAALVADTRLRTLPVVVMTTSRDEHDVRDMYSLGCNTYIVKPRVLSELENIIQVVCRYWFTVAALPPSIR